MTPPVYCDFRDNLAGPSEAVYPDLPEECWHDYDTGEAERREADIVRRKLDRTRSSFDHSSPAARPEETIFRHSAWARKRALVKATLESTGTTTAAMDRFNQCGAECVVERCAEDGTLRCRGTYCHCRHCEPCMKQKANLIAANLRHKLDGMREYQYRFLTLTLKHTDTPLADQIKHLYRSFATLRRTTDWKNSQDGGCSMLEIKWEAKTRKWHPHLHVVADGKYLSKKFLSETWSRITGGSFIVDIRQLTRANDAAYYVAKYISKGSNNDVWTDRDAAQEFVIATKGVRTCATFGTWRGFALLKHEDDTRAWLPLGTLCQIIQRAQAGDPKSMRILAQLQETVKYDPTRTREQRKCPDRLPLSP